MFGSILDAESSYHSGFEWKGQDAGQKDMIFTSPTISQDFIEPPGINLLQGRSFSNAHQNESSKIIINEAAAKLTFNTQVKKLA